jgi:jasmonate ZIM domain-containing protein
MATAAGSIQQGHGARFAVACDVLSRYVKAAAAATTPTPVEQPRPLPGTVVGVVLPLMPGADLSTQAEELAEAADQAGPAPRAQQLMTISYGGRVVVLDDVPADTAAELLRLAAAAAAPRVLRAPDDLPMARKASLRHFMEKRKGRVAKRASPYSRPGDAGAAAASSFPDHLALSL